MDSPRAQFDRTLLVILGVIVALVIVALAFIFSRGEPATLDESTPESVVQRYSAAVISGDEDAAERYLVPTLADDCVRIQPGSVNSMRVTLVDTVERDDSADVRVLIVTTLGSGMLGPDEYQEEGSFDLVRDGSEWRIETVPWPLAICDPTAVNR
ncbi:hypothetical protein PX701_18525 [Agromyces sp. H3Y2-19a]|uniref:hypothetical protein n=1 Tax=Agromyces chromiiresistens TaxID=3030835 RepID=UPI0023B92A46|nr:hypothetical protein [Agromyces chromiiresistens]MDF0515623.1 hypothetical protein [Agromyces chromiiresistens]